MNRIVIVLSITVVVLGIVSGFLLYQFNAIQSLNSELRSQNAELQNQIIEKETQLDKYTNMVEITNFSSSGFGPVGGLLIESKANVTIQNLGVNNVEGLTLTIKCSTAENFEDIRNLEVLLSGEKRKLIGSVYWTLDTIGWVTITLTLGDVVIDEYIIPSFPNT